MREQRPFKSAIIVDTDLMTGMAPMEVGDPQDPQGAMTISGASEHLGTETEVLDGSQRRYWDVCHNRYTLDTSMAFFGNLGIRSEVCAHIVSP